MNPEAIRAWAPIIAAMITAGSTLLVTIIKILSERPKQNRSPITFSKVKIYGLLLAIITLFGAMIGYYLGVKFSRLPFQSGGQEILLLPVKIPSQTPTPIPRGDWVMEINFSDNTDGKCNDYDLNLLGYENRQYYIKPAPNGFIAICHENEQLEPEGSLQVIASSEGAVPDPYGFAVLVGWKGNSLNTTDACIFGIRRKGATTEAYYSNRVGGAITSYTQELQSVQLDNAPHILRIVLHRDGNAIGYLDERYFAEHKFLNCARGPVGIVAWGPGDTKIYFDDLKFYKLP